MIGKIAVTQSIKLLRQSFPAPAGRTAVADNIHMIENPMTPALVFFPDNNSLICNLSALSRTMNDRKNVKPKHISTVLKDMDHFRLYLRMTFGLKRPYSNDNLSFSYVFDPCSAYSVFYHNALVPGQNSTSECEHAPLKNIFDFLSERRMISTAPTGRLMAGEIRLRPDGTITNVDAAIVNDGISAKPPTLKGFLASKESKDFGCAMSGLHFSWDTLFNLDTSDGKEKVFLGTLIDPDYTPSIEALRMTID